MPKTVTFDASIKKVAIVTKVDDEGDRYPALNVVLETDANVVGIIQRLVGLQNAGRLRVELEANQHELPFDGKDKDPEAARA